jgi:hypothetical protein
MKRPAFALFAGLLLLGLLPGSTLAGVLVTDQSQEVNTKYWYGPTTFAQTFTVGKAGSLGGVDLFMAAVSATNVDVKIETLDRTTKFPLLPANVKAAGTIVVDDGKWYHLDLTPFNILVGAQLAIVFNLSSSNVYVYGAAGAASYTGGVACQLSGGSWGPNSSPSDFAFRTYVGLPIPTAPPPTPSPTKPAMATLASTLPPTSAPTAIPAGPSAGDASVTPPAANATETAAPGSGSGSGSSDSGGAMLLIVGVILVVLALAVGVVGFLLGRRGSKAGPPAAGAPPAGPPPYNPPPSTPPAA